MKITIEFDGTLEAACEIDGKPFTVKMARIQGFLGYRAEGLTDHEMDNTLGGRLAVEMVGPVSDLMQAVAAAQSEGAMLEGEDVWQPVSEEALSAFSERLS